MWGVGCGVWGASCGLWAVGCGLWAVGCGLWAVGCGLWAVGASLPHTHVPTRDLCVHCRPSAVQSYWDIAKREVELRRAKKRLSVLEDDFKKLQVGCTMGLPVSFYPVVLWVAGYLQ